MSRIGKMPIQVPAGLDVKIENGLITVKKGKEELSERISQGINVRCENNVIYVERENDLRQTRSLHGLTRTLIHNMITGLEHGFVKNLEITGVGYRAAMEGKTLVMNIGYSHPVKVEQPAGITFEVPAPNKIIVKGASKQLVGETAAVVRSKRKPDSYKGKGIRYEGEFVRIKVGKTGSKGE